VRVVHIDREALAANARKGTDLPVVELLADGEQICTGNELEIRVGDRLAARIVYRPDERLPSGASCWVEVADEATLRWRS
jgi:hypothetical protein